MDVLQFLLYFSVSVSVIAILYKVIKIARMPVHLRWDLYPIPHEKGRGKYGGSYYEEVDWWTKPKNFSLISELTEMAKEIIFVHSVFKNNRSLWIFSFPFHFGMYCLIGFVVLLILGAIMGSADVAVSALSSSDWGVAVHFATVIIGTAGWILAGLGAVGLLLSRMFNHDLSRATVRSDYTNLILLLAVFVAGFVAWMTVDPSYATLRGYIQSMITFQAAGPLPTAITVQLWLLAALLCYFPFTHMTHMVTKYFTYHTVRWADEPNSSGSKIEKAVTEALGYRLNWSASHVKTGGTWAEAATATGEDSSDE